MSSADCTRLTTGFPWNFPDVDTDSGGDAVYWCTADQIVLYGDLDGE